MHKVLNYNKNYKKKTKDNLFHKISLGNRRPESEKRKNYKNKLKLKFTIYRFWSPGIIKAF